MKNISGMPDWWKKAIAIEYLSCRDYTRGERIGKFNFELISDQDLEEALSVNKVVSYGYIIQNIDPDTFRNRALLSLASPIVKPIVNGDSDAIIPQGVVSKHHFPFTGNSIDTVDPIESFNSHIQVLDDGILYQWKVARLERVEGRHFGRWVSDYVDLSSFDSTHDDFQELMSLKAKVSCDSNIYVDAASKYIEKLRAIRRVAFSELLKVHYELKEKDTLSKRKTVPYQPPSLSNFETMKIEDGEIYTVCSAAPMFYRAALRHCRSAIEIFSNSQGNQPHVLDQIHEERAQAIIMASACLEAISNEIGSDKFGSIWTSLEKLTPIEKMKFMFSFSSPPMELDTSKHPFQYVSKIISVRNEMIHFKHEFKKVKVKEGVAISRMESLLSVEIIDSLPSVLKDSIVKIYSVVGLNDPEWVNDQLGWKVSENV
jgi:hypothetical protein